MLYLKREFLGAADMIRLLHAAKGCGKALLPPFWVFKYTLPKMLILIRRRPTHSCDYQTSAFKHHVLFPLLKAPLCNQLELSRKILKFSRRLGIYKML